MYLDLSIYFKLVAMETDVFYFSKDSNEVPATFHDQMGGPKPSPQSCEVVLTLFEFICELNASYQMIFQTSIHVCDVF